MSNDPITALLTVGNSVIERVWPDPTKQALAKLELERLAQAGDSAKLQAHIQAITGQLNINKVEASSKSIFVAGWRPFVGWVCGFGLLYAVILEPAMRFIAMLCGYVGGFPVIDTSITMQVLLGMLGLGMMRTREKEKGVHKDSLKSSGR